MVSLEAKAEYWKPLRATPLVSFFIDLLDGRPVRPASIIPDPAESASIVEHLLTCVHENDCVKATAFYTKLSARRLSPESELVHDDFAVFTVVCAVRKFQLDDRWLREVIRMRPVDEIHKRLTTKTFENILAGNDNAREDYHQVSVVFQLVTGQYQPDVERLNKMVSYLWRHPFPWFDSEFLTIVSMRAIRAAFEAKGLLNPEQRFATEQFVNRFTRRVALISGAVSWVVFVAAVGSLAALALFYAEDPKGKIVLGTLAAFGLGLSAIADLRKWVVTHVDSLLKKLLGYNFAPKPT